MRFRPSIDELLLMDRNLTREKMNRGLVSFADQLDKVALTPEPEPKERTPAPMRTKVVSVASREPVNRQAAMIIAKPPWWAKLEFDVPDRPPPVVTVEDLREAHLENSRLAKRVEKLRSENLALLRELELENLRVKHERNIRLRLEKELKALL